MEALSLFDASPGPGPGTGGARVGTTLPDPHPRLAAPAPPTAQAPQAVPGPTVLAVDGNSLAHRAFHAYGTQGMGSRSGGDRSAVYGFVALLAGIAERTSPDGLVVGFDCRHESHRRRWFKQYKANRPPKDPALHALLDLLAGVLDDLDVPVVVHPGWEADDVVGSAAAVAEGSGWRCVVATSDKDALALVSERTTVLRLRSGLDRSEEITPRRLRRRVGIEADQYTEFAALRGDPSDTLPGIPGIGPARAAALLQAFPTVAAAVADPLGCRSVLGPGPGQAVLDDLAKPDESVFLRNVRLMRLRRDLEVDLDRARRRLPPEEVPGRLAAWGLQGLAGRAAMAFAARPERVPPPVHAPGG